MSAKTVVPEDSGPEVDMTEQLLENLPPATKDALVRVNMEAPVTGDDVILTGGLGATNDDSSVISHADSFTNFEASPRDSNEAINMEASATAEEVIRAGGFGATDDISSFLPVASDFTDFEAHLRDVEDYEDLEKDTARPGLGWTNDSP